MFQRAVRFVEYEQVPGDIVEFGVYTGRSLALLNQALREFQESSQHATKFNRTAYGIDHFKGLPENPHPRWDKGLFKKTHSWHPTIKKGQRVTAQKVSQSFKKMYLRAPLPEIIETDVNDMTNLFGPDGQIGQVAIAHFDLDLTEPTIFALKAVLPTLQQGSLLLFDDWFNFKGDPCKGEQAAVREILGYYMPDLVPYQTYATFCNSFIFQKR